MMVLVELIDHTRRTISDLMSDICIFNHFRQIYNKTIAYSQILLNSPELTALNSSGQQTTDRWN